MKPRGSISKPQRHRKAPSESAATYAIGDTAKGSDGHMWSVRKVRKPSGGFAQRWVRTPPKRAEAHEHVLIKNFPTSSTVVPFDTSESWQIPTMHTKSIFKSESEHLGVAMKRGRRPYMEDVVFARSWMSDGHQTFAVGVLDGHGGDDTSKRLRKLLPSAIAAGLGENFDADDVDQTKEINSKLVHIFWQLNRQLETDPKQRHRNTGSTATVVIWQHERDTIWWAWVGDSEAGFVMSDGRFKQLTTLEHKPTKNKRETSRVCETGAYMTPISDDQYYVHLDGVRIGMTRAMGDTGSYAPFSPSKSKNPMRMVEHYAVSPIPFVGHTHLPSDAYVVIASDGMWDVLDYRKVGRAIARFGSDVGASARELVRRAIAKGSNDNVSVLVFVPGLFGASHK
jgi:serine/threonine protein phosphatase PrpC